MDFLAYLRGDDGGTRFNITLDFVAQESKGVELVRSGQLISAEWEMYGYTKNDMLDHPATLITRYSHAGKVNPDAMHKVISAYLPPMLRGKLVAFDSEQISSRLQKAFRAARVVLLHQTSD